MNPAFRPFSAGSDELLLSGHLLSALEVGRLGMHAEDYRAIAARASMLLDGFETAVLLRMRREGPRALREMAENVLHERGAFEWTTYDPVRKRARMLCVALLLGLMASNG